MPGGFANDFKPADDRVLCPLIGEELLPAHSGKVLLNYARRVKNVGEIRVILRHRSAWRSKEWLGDGKDCGCVQWPTG